MSRIDENSAYFGNGVKRAMAEENNDKSYRPRKRMSATAENFFLALNPEKVTSDRIRALQDKILDKRAIEQELESSAREMLNF